MTDATGQPRVSEDALETWCKGADILEIAWINTLLNNFALDLRDARREIGELRAMLKAVTPPFEMSKQRCLLFGGETWIHKSDYLTLTAALEAEKARAKGAEEDADRLFDQLEQSWKDLGNDLMVKCDALIQHKRLISKRKPAQEGDRP